MDDAEAEAALLALGNVQLEWVEVVPIQRMIALYDEMGNRVRANSCPEGVEFYARLNASRSVGYAMTDTALYEVRVRRQFYLLPRYTASFIADSPFRCGVHPDEFKHLATAKAACERHHATGKWE